MKTQPLKRNDDGSYTGAIAGEHALTAKEQRKVREVLSTGPMYVSAIADQCGISRTNPARFDLLCKFVSYLGEHTQEAEMIFEQAKAGRKFIGWKLTEHGQKMLEIS
jgi:hypothetical protein